MGCPRAPFSLSSLAGRRTTPPRTRRLTGTTVRVPWGSTETRPHSPHRSLNSFEGGHVLAVPWWLCALGMAGDGHTVLPFVPLARPRCRCSARLTQVPSLPPAGWSAPATSTWRPKPRMSRATTSRRTRPLPSESPPRPSARPGAPPHGTAPSPRPRGGNPCRVFLTAVATVAPLAPRPSRL